MLLVKKVTLLVMLLFITPLFPSMVERQREALAKLNINQAYFICVCSFLLFLGATGRVSKIYQSIAIDGLAVDWSGLNRLHY